MNQLSQIQFVLAGSYNSISLRQRSARFREKFSRTQLGSNIWRQFNIYSTGLSNIGIDS